MDNEIVLVDWMNFLFTNFHAARASLYKSKGIKEITEDEIPFVYHMELKGLFNILKTYNNVIICKEGENSLRWRRSIFSGYKENRKQVKASDEYRVFMDALSSFEEVLNYLNVKVVRVDNVEADDVIYALTEKYHKENDILIISSDKDLIQLKNYFGDNVNVYNLVKKKFLEKDELIVQKKAIIGDASDGISGIPRIGEKTFEKIIEDKNEWNKKMKNGNLELYKKFLKIVDLRELPKEYKDNIIKEDEKQTFNSFQEDDVEMFLFENNLNQLLNNWNITKNDIRRTLNES